MVLLEPEPTQFDLRWRMFGTPVRVHPMFWLLACLLGMDLLNGPNGLQLLLLWVACVFVSILVHEFGHIFMGRAFGNRGQVVLYSFGGLAIGSSDTDRRWKRIAVSLAGPAAGFVLYGFAELARIHGLPQVETGPTYRWLRDGLNMLIWINLYWGLLNLLPIWPLDGGQVSRELSLGASQRNGLVISLGISFLLAALIAVNALLAANRQPSLPYLPSGGYWTVILFGMLAVESFQLLQQARAQRHRSWDDDDPWRRY
ncbi:MAG: hypothetical protein IT429_05430 [Gemmataceae bacterium]|nr:hypothetical protein [Gemmataceae bacterium]